MVGGGERQRSHFATGGEATVLSPGWAALAPGLPPPPAPADAPAAAQQRLAPAASKAAAGKHHATCIRLAKREKNVKYWIMKITGLMQGSQKSGETSRRMACQEAEPTAAQVTHFRGHSRELLPAALCTAPINRMLYGDFKQHISQKELLTQAAISRQLLGVFQPQALIPWVWLLQCF